MAYGIGTYSSRSVSVGTHSFDGIDTVLLHTRDVLSIPCAAHTHTQHSYGSVWHGLLSMVVQ